mgnify:FL=1
MTPTEETLKRMTEDLTSDEPGIVRHLIGEGRTFQEVRELVLSGAFDISLDSWLGVGATSQGMPKPEIPKGDLYYWNPRENRVARFDAYSYRAFLNCGRNPGSRNSVLGVFAVAEGGK